MTTTSRPAYAPVTQAMVYLTMRCNVACHYCFQTHVHDAMSQETAQKTIEFLFNRLISGIEQRLFLTFFGGEPFLEVERMEEMVDYCRARERQPGTHKRVFFSATTNGTLATPDVERVIRKAGMSLLVSLDGGPHANAARAYPSGRASYEAVARNLPRLVSWSPDLRVRMTFHPRSLDIVDNIRHLFSLGAPAVVVAPVFEADWTGTADKVEAEFQALADWYIAEARAGRHLALDITDTMLMELHRNQDSGRRPTGPCGMGKRLIGISTSGAVMPCHRFLYRPDDWLGTVDTPVLSEKREPFQHLSTADILGCDGCVAAPMCGGGCPLVALQRGLNLNEPHPVYCTLTRIHARAVRRIYQTLMAEANPVLLGLLRRGGPATHPALSEMVYR